MAGTSQIAASQGSFQGSNLSFSSSNLSFSSLSSGTKWINMKNHAIPGERRRVILSSSLDSRGEGSKRPATRVSDVGDLIA